MKVTAQTVTEFKKFRHLLQSAEQPLLSLQNGQTELAQEGLKKVLSDFEALEISLTDMNIKEATSLCAESLRLQLKLFFSPNESPDSEKMIFKKFTRNQANFQGKLALLILAVDAYQNPSMKKSFAVIVTSVLDKFRV
jgi:hypothetical protein